MKQRASTITAIAGSVALLYAIGHRFKWFALARAKISSLRVLFVQEREIFPSDLHSWRMACDTDDLYEVIWDRIGQVILHREGFILWTRADELNQGFSKPPEPNNYNFLSAITPTSLYHLTYWSNQNGLAHAVRGNDNKDYVIRLVSVADEGRTHLRILRKLSSLPDSLLSNNHILPMVKEIKYENLTFAAFPKVNRSLTSGFGWPFKNSVEDMVYMLMQALEGIVYIHKNRIAHRDLFLDNFMVEWFPESRIARTSVLRPRVYLIDFETTVDFPEDSPPSSRLSTDLPFPEPLPYYRPKAPELMRDEPYCPFRLDMWQFGCQIIQYFECSGIPEIDAIWPTLLADNPQDRPTANEVLQQLDAIVRSMPPSALDVSLKTEERGKPSTPSSETDSIAQF